MKRYLVLLVFVAITMAATAKGELKVVSFNIRNSMANDGGNSWQYRQDLVAEYFKQTKPDVFGMQEVLQNQLDYLSAQIIGYDHVGVAREDGKRQGEYAPIFYNKQRFDLKKSSTIWLSPTPEVVGSIGWDAALTRVATYALLYDKKEKRDILVVNSHFDHIGAKAREESVLLIRRLLKQLGAEYYIVTGDFNFNPTERPYAEVVSVREGYPTLLDSRTTAANRSVFEKSITFNAYGNKTDACIIDYVLYSPSIKAVEYKVDAVIKDGLYISDHFPVAVRLEYK